MCRLYLLIIVLLPLKITAQVPTPDETVKSVVHIVTDEGTCNGVLLNHNQASDRFFVLTAAHCVREENSFLAIIAGRDYLTENKLVRSAEWHSNSPLKLITSADLDYVLLELDEAIPDHLFPYKAGWSSLPAIPPATYAIHSPLIDKLFAEDLNAPSTATFSQISTFGGNPVAAGTYRIDRWEQGFTAAGSSGAPLFDLSSRVIGILSGGSSTEELPVNDFFGRFDLMYADGLKNFLDPGSVSGGVLNGEDYAVRQKGLSKISNYLKTDSVDAIVTSTRIAEFFNLNESRALEGIYLPVLQVDPTDLITLTIYSGNNIIHRQQIFSNELIPFSENFISLDRVINVSNAITVELVHNQSFQMAQLQCQNSTVVVDDQSRTNRSVMISLLTEGPVQTNAVDTPISHIYPNPSTQNFYLDQKVIPFISTIEVFDNFGRPVHPEISTDYFNRVLINMSFLQKGMYYIKYKTNSNEFFDRVLLF